jgi:hypothetical protein
MLSEIVQSTRSLFPSRACLRPAIARECDFPKPRCAKSAQDTLLAPVNPGSPKPSILPVSSRLTLAAPPTDLSETLAPAKKPNSPSKQSTLLLYAECPASSPARHSHSSPFLLEYHLDEDGKSRITAAIFTLHTLR